MCACLSVCVQMSVYGYAWLCVCVCVHICVHAEVYVFEFQVCIPPGICDHVHDRKGGVVGFEISAF